MRHELSQLARQQLEVEASALRQHLTDRGDSTGDDWLGGLLNEQAEARVHNIEQTLAGQDPDAFALTFFDRVDAHAHRMATTTLTNLLSRFQKAVTFAGWARLAGPGVAGTPPALISRTFETEVTALAPGSFVIELEPHERTLEHDALHGALDDLLEIATAAGDNRAQVSERAEELAQTLGAEALRRFALFFRKVHEAQLEMSFEWSSMPDDTLHLLPDEARDLASWLENVEEEFESVTITGSLSAADANDGRFAITDAQGEIYEGKAAPEILSRATIDEFYTAQVRVQTITSTLTRRDRQRLVLESLERIAPPPN